MFPFEDVVILDGSSFGGSSSAVVLDDVICLGDENSLLDCSHTISQFSCATAGVSCGGKTISLESGIAISHPLLQIPALKET